MADKTEPDVRLSSEAQQARTFGMLALLWGIYPLGDYILTYLIGYPYLKVTMDDVMIESFSRITTDLLVSWYIMVFGMLGGAILLIRRSRFAVWGFLATAATSLANNIDTIILRPIPDADYTFIARITGAGLLFGIYSWIMWKRGVLR